MAVRIVVTDHGFPDLAVEAEVLKAIGGELDIHQCKTEAEVIKAATGAHAILTQWAPITRQVMASLTKCKVIVRYGIGVDNVDLEAAGERGIPVVNVPDYALDEVADHAMTLLLALARKLPEVTGQVRAGEWSVNPARPLHSLRGKTLGLAGFGNIARKMARRAQVFGIRTIAYDPYVPVESMAEERTESVDFPELLAQSHYVSVHLPLVPETRHMFNKQAFGSMKPGAILVNTSRGGVIHTQDLADALIGGQLGGAGLDVLEQEPIATSSPLLSLSNAMITSHCAWYTEEALERLKRFAALEIVRVFKDGEPKHIVNRKWLR